MNSQGLKHNGSCFFDVIVYSSFRDLRTGIHGQGSTDGHIGSNYSKISKKFWLLVWSAQIYNWSWPSLDCPVQDFSNSVPRSLTNWTELFWTISTNHWYMHVHSIVSIFFCSEHGLSLIKSDDKFRSGHLNDKNVSIQPYWIVLTASAGIIL